MTLQAPKLVAVPVRQVTYTMTQKIHEREAKPLLLQVSLCSPRDPSSIVDMYCDDEFALSLEFHPNMLLYPVQGVTSMEAELGKIDGEQSHLGAPLQDICIITIPPFQVHSCQCR